MPANVLVGESSTFVFVTVFDVFAHVFSSNSYRKYLNVEVTTLQN